jgi:hypothetical protein
MPLINLTVDVEEGLGLWAQSSTGNHFGSVKRFAHRDIFKMLNVGMKDGLIVIG